MICPKCGSDTSDLVLRCEFCGNLLISREGTGPVEPKSPLEDVPAPGGAPYAGLPPSEVPRIIPCVEAPRERVFGAASRTPTPGGRTPWYYRPWPYVVAIVVVLGVVVGLLAFRGGADAYPSLWSTGCRHCWISTRTRDRRARRWRPSSMGWRRSTRAG